MESSRPNENGATSHQFQLQPGITHADAYAHVHIHMYTCIHIHIYTYTHILHIYTYVYTYMHRHGHINTDTSSLTYTDTQTDTVIPVTITYIVTQTDTVIPVTTLHINRSSRAILMARPTCQQQPRTWCKPYSRSARLFARLSVCRPQSDPRVCLSATIRPQGLSIGHNRP